LVLLAFGDLVFGEAAAAAVVVVVVATAAVAAFFDGVAVLERLNG
jgi:hypothetical protein